MKACQKKAKNKKKWQTLCYPIPIKTNTKKIADMLELVKQASNKYLRKYCNEEILNSLEQGTKRAYKILEDKIINEQKLPSRINRGALEITGRTLRGFNDRKTLYELLLKVEPDPNKWDYKKLIKQEQIYKKSQYVVNLKEQMLNFIAKNEFPENYFQLQKPPKIKNAIITYAPDDGQAIKIEQNKQGVSIKIKVINKEDDKVKWEWIEIKLQLPENLRNVKLVAPDLRWDCIHDQWLPVLDYKIEVPCQDEQKPQCFLTVDWGIRKIITIGIFDKQGRQITTPIFLKFEPIQKKLLRIRKEIDYLKVKRDILQKNSSLWRKYNREIARRWRKYRAINKSLAHLTANVIVLIAKIYNAEVYFEWLKSLRSKNKSKKLNWLINSTIRQVIYDNVHYKAKLLGVKVNKPLPPAYTSQYCPRCGKKGHHIKAPDCKDQISKKYGWFVCQHCGFNADRDYVGCCNLARKVLYGNSFKNLSKGVVYQKTPISGLLFCQSSSLLGKQLFHNLKGWKKSVFLKSGFFCSTLRL